MKRNYIFGLLVCLALAACGSAESQTEAALVAATDTPTAVPTATATPEPTLTSTPVLWATATAEYNEMSIRAAFEQFRTALLTGDGQSALEVVTSLDIERYDDLVVFAQSLTRDELDSLELFYKFVILRLRHTFSRAELENMTGEDAIIISIERGWIGLANIEQFEIDEIDIGTTPGNANVTFVDFPANAGMFFIREGGRHWRVFLGQYDRASNQELNLLIRDSGLSEDAFFSSLLELLSDKPVDPRIFEGPVE